MLVTPWSERVKLTQQLMVKLYLITNAQFALKGMSLSVRVTLETGSDIGLPNYQDNSDQSSIS